MAKRAKTAAPRSKPVMPVTVAEGAYHRPLFVMVEGQKLRVDSIERQCVKRPGDS